MAAVLSDVAIERGLLSILMKHSQDVYVEIQDVISASVFTLESNRIIYSCAKAILERQEETILDFASIISAAKDLGYGDFFGSKHEFKHLQAVAEFPAAKENVFAYAEKLQKLHTIRFIHEELEAKAHGVLDFSGNESISEILELIEFDFSKLLQTGADSSLIGEDIKEFAKRLEDNPVDQIGVSTGYAILDDAIGGGMRDGAVTVIGARPGIGKSTVCNNIADFVTKNNGYAYYLDTEMTREDQQVRLLALNSGVKIRTIETGKFGELESDRQKVYAAIDDIEKREYYHESIAGVSFQTQLGLMRKFILGTVGLDENKKAKRKTIIFYDYLKIMDSEAISDSIREFQALGFIITALHNFAVRYGIHFVATVQLNRDGITKESTDAASGSDRIVWLCSNFIIFKPKSDKEIGKDGGAAGNRKMVVLKARHGPGLDGENYINFRLSGDIGRLEEGKTSYEINKEKVVDEPSDDQCVGV